MEPRLRASPEQFYVLIDFMERHGDLSRPQSGPQGRIKGDWLWTKLTDILNSLGGGVQKSSDKWKKAWADWKTKTKKKYLSLRHQANGTGGGPSSRANLTALEERVVAVMGVSAVLGQAGIQDYGFNRTSNEVVGVVVEHAGIAEDHSQNIAVATSPVPPIPQPLVLSSSPLPPPPPSPPRRTPSPPRRTPPPPRRTPPPPRRTPPPPRRTPPPPTRRQALASPRTTATTPRRALLRARRNRGVTPFERAADRFAAVEQRRLEHEEARDRRLHEREMERLRLEAERIEVARQNNILLQQLSLLGQRLMDIISNQRPFN